ncbi:MAG: hypothetical protein JWN34_6117 [Bryobacterales bacterium]|jgi:hypothetical protein|nr:hypothetical protein [Bryobacterales bacterium]
MTRYSLVTIALAASAFAAGPVDAVREAALGWRQGAVKQDKAALSRFLSDELVYAHGGGKTQSKAEYIADVTNGSPHYEAFTDRGTKVRLYGHTAVLTGLVEVKPAKGESYQVHTLEVYIEKDGHWQLAQKESVRVKP